MRITALETGVETDLFHDLIDVSAAIFRRDEAVEARGFADDLLHPHPRVKAGEGILKDHLDRERGSTTLDRVHRHDVLAVEDNRPV